LVISSVSFAKIGEEMADDFPTENLTLFINNLQNEQWYGEYRQYRRCTTHWYSIDFRVEYTRLFLETTTETSIILSDNPVLQPPTYNMNRKIAIFGNEIFKNTLDVIDKMYGILENKIRTANQIPV